MPERSTSDTIESSQDLVRALRSASDPPTAGGPLKIEIAQSAWNNASFYVPSKAELIADWVLAKLLKEKGKEVCVEALSTFTLSLDQVSRFSQTNKSHLRRAILATHLELKSVPRSCMDHGRAPSD
jgi:hypothetical protein